MLYALEALMAAVLVKTWGWMPWTASQPGNAVLIFAHLVYVLTLLNAQKQLFSGYLQTKEHNLESIKQEYKKTPRINDKVFCLALLINRSQKLKQNQ